MENLLIEGTDTLPNVEMNIEGSIKLEGRALPEDAVKYFEPILNWTTNFEGALLNVDLNLEYFNTSVSKQLHNFLEILDKKTDSCEVNVVWNYEEGDDEMLESGEIYDELFPGLNFDFKEYEEIMD